MVRSHTGGYNDEKHTSCCCSDRNKEQEEKTDRCGGDTVLCGCEFLNSKLVNVNLGGASAFHDSKQFFLFTGVELRFVISHRL